MLTKSINFKNFKSSKSSKSNKKIKKDLEFFLKEKNEVLKSLNVNYKNSYNKKTISKFKRYSNIRIVGMGGSILGAEAINEFLKHKIKKNFYFINNLKPKINSYNKPYSLNK